jgi:protein involved in polysaccharide export with SLBB domain
MASTRLIHRCAFMAWLLASAAALSLLLGCSTVHNLFGQSSTPKSKPSVTTGDEISGRLRSGDEVVIRIDTGGAQPTTPAPSDITIDEDGNISLPLVGSIKAAGLTGSELAERIQANYVPRYYVRCNASVMVAARFFYVGGEVRNPNRFAWSEDTTLLKAISTASGFTDYANRQKVQLSRGGKLEVYNCEDLQRNPVNDPAVRPGDTITVPRSIF